MSRITIAFFGAAVLYALGGMALGMYMGAHENFTLAPVHAHINLLGWGSLAIMGAFYGLAGDGTPKRLAWANFIVSNLGNLVMLPLVTLLLLGDRSVIPFMVAGEMLVVLGMILFGLALLNVAREPATA